MTIETRAVRDCFTAHEPCDVLIEARCSEELQSGSQIDVQFPHSWSLVSGPSFTRAFQCSDPAAPHYVRISATGNLDWRHDVIPRTQHYPAGQHRHGRMIRATLQNGRVPAGEVVRIAYRNTVAPFVAETDRVWLAVNGCAPDALPTLTVGPLPGESLRVLAPSAARPGEPFDILIVSLDRFENASSTCFTDETLFFADGRVACGQLSFRGRTRISVTIDEPGVHRLRFRGVLSNAVRVGPSVAGPFWGDIHIHTKLSHDAQGTDPYAYARDVSGLDFAAAADHVQSLGTEGYEQLVEWARRADDPGRFAVILADERNPRALTGHHNLYFRDEEMFLAHRWIGAQAPELPEDSGPVDPARMMVIPHHTGIHFGGISGSGRRTNAVDWDAYADSSGLRPAIEIYSHHGQSESYCPHHILAYEFNRMRNPERRGNTSVPGPHYAQNYWQRGLRLGAIASSDEHSGQGGRRHGGITAAFAAELSREAIFDAIRARASYATTGERILLDFRIGETTMGQVAACRPGERLELRLDVWGTDMLVRTEILRYRFGVDDAFTPILAELPSPSAQGLDASVRVSDTVEGPCVYYARVLQEPLSWPGMAWSSPIWVETT